MNRILYLHGFASAPSSSKAQFFRRILESAGATVEIPDLNEGDFEHLTITRQLALLERIASGAPVGLMGSSLGGYLAALYAARHPEVSRMVLLAPAFAFQTRWHERYGAAAIQAWRADGTAKVYHYADACERPIWYGLLEDAAKYESFPDFAQPALIFHGERDDVVPAGYSRDFAARHPNARLQIVDSGHDLLNVLDDLAPQVRRFFAA
jgi:uncharacterized protein